jgi:hypothetical protein
MVANLDRAGPKRARPKRAGLKFSLDFNKSCTSSSIMVDGGPEPHPEQEPHPEPNPNHKLAARPRIELI